MNYNFLLIGYQRKSMSVTESSSNGVEPPATIEYSLPLGSDMWSFGKSVSVDENYRDNVNVETSLDKEMRQLLEEQNVESSLDRGKRYCIE